jgi:hypothetical protein
MLRGLVDVEFINICHQPFDLVQDPFERRQVNTPNALRRSSMFSNVVLSGRGRRHRAGQDLAA